MDQNQPSKHKYKPAACPMLLRSTCYPEGLDSWVFLKYRGTTKGCETQPFINCPESLQFLLVKYGWLCLTCSPTMAGLLLGSCVILVPTLLPVGQIVSLYVQWGCSIAFIDFFGCLLAVTSFLYRWKDFAMSQRQEKCGKTSHSSCVQITMNRDSFSMWV